MFNFLWLIWDHYLPLTQWNIILNPRREGYKNRYLWQGTFVFMVLCSKFAFWVNLHGCYGCQGCQSLLVGVKGTYWSQISHRKLNISIWVPSIYVNPPKDLLLSSWGTSLKKACFHVISFLGQAVQEATSSNDLWSKYQQNMYVINCFLSFAILF